MKNITIITAAAAILAIASPTTSTAQYLHGGGAGEPVLHIGRWKECSFQLDPSLTKEAWKQFTREAGMVVYFRPLTDARLMGKGSFEVSMLQWKTVTGLDLVGSKSLSLTRRVALSPYAGVSGYLTRSFERSAVVNLANESALGVQGMAGATLSGYGVRLAMEYNVAEVNSISMKIGFGR